MSQENQSPKRRCEPNAKTKRKIREKLLEQYGNACHWCKQPMERPTIEHLTPLALGGTNEMHNLRLACNRCNNARGSDADWPYWFVGNQQTANWLTFADLIGRQ